MLLKKHVPVVVEKNKLVHEIRKEKLTKTNVKKCNIFTFYLFFNLTSKFCLLFHFFAQIALKRDCGSCAQFSRDRFRAHAEQWRHFSQIQFLFTISTHVDIVNNSDYGTNNYDK